MKAARKEESTPKSRYLILLTLIVVSVWLGMGWYASTKDEPGQFGDMFGAANALFSALAFAMLIYTIILQKAELRLQRLELSDTRKELEGQRIQMERQSDQMKKDGFESSFFKVFTVLQDIVSSMRVVNAEYSLAGRECFKDFYNYLSRSYNGSDYYRSDEGVLLRHSEEERVEVAYAYFFNMTQGDLSHYFRTLYNLIKFVDRSDIPDKKFYMNLVRAQLSRYEMVLIFYNCNYSVGEKFKPLVERHALLKNMVTGDLLDASHQAYLAPEALGGITQA